MNTLPSYEAQFNKITEAYIKGEIKPFDSEFCFCGTLANGCGWTLIEYTQKSYTYKEFGRMERELFSSFDEIRWLDNGSQDRGGIHYKNIVISNGYEEKLFNGMCAALEVLKQIHIERGEVIDNPKPFVKRSLQTQETNN